MDNQIQTIGELIRTMEKEDKTGNTAISKYVNHSMRETIETVDAYINSRHISGSKDSANRDKPFFNIVIAARNIYYRATDIDRKDIKLRAVKKADMVLSLLATILLQQFMRKSAFGSFLNEWGRTLSTYGSAVSKFVEKGGELYPSVIPWNRVICDPVDFDNNVKIEKLWLTPAQLRQQKEYNQDMVEQLLRAKEVRENMEGQKKDNKSDYIEVYEAHGLLPLSFITGMDDDDEVYTDQMHVVSFVAKRTGTLSKDKPEYDDYSLYMGKEAKCPYQIDSLIPEDGRTLAIGSVENLFESQWMLNHNKKLIKDQLDLASRIFFQTSDANFVGQNVLTDMIGGEVLVWNTDDGGSRLEQVNNSSHDIVALQNYGNEWKTLSNEINGISEAMLGVRAKSGTAWRQTQAELSESHSLFELMTENKGLAIEKMLREYIIPFHKKKMDTTEEISDILEEYQINKIDAMYVPQEATKRVNKKIIKDILGKTKEEILQGNLYMPEQQEQDTLNEQANIQQSLNQMGNQRFIKPSEIPTKTWKKVLKDFEWEVEVDITGENKNKEAAMETLSTLLQVIVNKQGQPFNPEEKVVIDKILSLTGEISPVELAQTKQQPTQMQPTTPSTPNNIANLK